jgi:hypothetical protein
MLIEAASVLRASSIYTILPFIPKIPLNIITPFRICIRPLNILSRPGFPAKYVLFFHTSHGLQNFRKYHIVNATP